MNTSAPSVPAIGKPTRLQLEIALLVGGTLMLLWLYRSYLERSLALQREYMDELLAEREREHAVAGNGKTPEDVVNALASWLENRAAEQAAEGEPAPPESAA